MQNSQLANTVRLPSGFFISVWNTLCSRAVCVYAPLFSTDYPPFTSPPSFSVLSSFQTDALGVLVRFKVWTSSDCHRKLYTCCSFTASGDHPRADPFCTAPKVTHSNSQLYLWEQGDRSCSRISSSLQALSLRGLLQENCLCVGLVSSLRMQGEYKRF